MHSHCIGGKYNLVYLFPPFILLSSKDPLGPGRGSDCGTILAHSREVQHVGQHTGQGSDCGTILANSRDVQHVGQHREVQHVGQQTDQGPPSTAAAELWT